jgi:cysteinyl-tRNA synthetase
LDASTIKKVLERYDANTIRYFLLTNHYRMPVDFNDEALQAAENRIVKIRRYFSSTLRNLELSIEATLNYIPNAFEEEDITDPVQSYFALEFKNALLSDLNSSQALAITNQLINHLKFGILQNANNDLSAGLEILYTKLSGETCRYKYKHGFQAYRRILSRALNLLNILGFDLQALLSMESPVSLLPKEEIRIIYKEMTGEWMAPDIAPEECLKTIVQMRKRAKEIKNWTQADAIRKHLTDIGLQLLDNKDGTTSVEKDGLEVVRV